MGISNAGYPQPIKSESELTPTACPAIQPTSLPTNLQFQSERVQKLCEFILEKARNKHALSCAEKCKKKNYEITELLKIRELDLSMRDLTDLPEELVFLEKLNDLDLCTNEFVQLPNWLNKMPNLSVITLNGNKFKEFPSVLLTCEKLHKAYLGSNPGIRLLPIEAKNIIGCPRPNHIKWISIKTD